MKSPNPEAIEAIATDALKTLPPELLAHVNGIAIRIQEFPDKDVEREFDLQSPFDLLGLYQGVSLDQKSVSATPEDLDRIFLYRRPILQYWRESGEDLEHLVRHVLIHEIGHHFGLDDDDMQRIEAEA